MEEFLIFTDCASLVSNVNSPNPQVSERRLLIDLQIIRELCSRYGIRILHISGKMNPADALTKRTPDNDGIAMRNLLEQNTIDLSCSGLATEGTRDGIFRRQKKGE